MMWRCMHECYLKCARKSPHLFGTIRNHRLSKIKPNVTFHSKQGSSHKEKILNQRNNFHFDTDQFQLVRNVWECNIGAALFDSERAN